MKTINISLDLLKSRFENHRTITTKHLASIGLEKYARGTYIISDMQRFTQFFNTLSNEAKTELLLVNLLDDRHEAMSYEFQQLRADVDRLLGVINVNRSNW